MHPAAPALPLDPAARAALDRLVRARTTPQKVALRARIVLCAAAGLANQTIATRLRTSRPTVLLWRQRFAAAGVPGVLRERPRPGRVPAISAEHVARVVDATLHTRPEGRTHWSVRTMARAHGLGRTTVHRIWQQYGLKPHRVKTFKLSRDPRFVEKVRDIVGLYLNPPDKAVVLCVDEKSQIQALERTQPLLPLRVGQPARHTHDYRRHGTTTLFAALNVLDGRVIGECHARHRGREFVAFLARLDRETPSELAVHVIVDNASTHKSPVVQRWLTRHRRFQLHFTPTSSSWLNLVERWFAALTEQRLRRDSFASVPSLIGAIEEYLAHTNDTPKPFVWTKDADMILGKVERCKAALGTGH
jgi:transposase